MQNVSSDVRKMARTGMDKAEQAAERVNDAYPEIDDIRKDWSALRKDVAKLTKHAASDGRKSLSNFKDSAIESIEYQVNEKPAQTLAIAFFAGAIASILLGRR